MGTYKIPTLYILLGVLVPGTVMVGSRYVGQASSETRASQLPIEMPILLNFPDISLMDTDRKSVADTESNLKSPFWFDQQDLNDFPEPFLPFPVEMPQAQDSRPEIFVTSILPNPKNPMAIINSRPFRIGDKVINGWKLGSIDGKNRTITLVNASGKRMVVALTKNP